MSFKERGFPGRETIFRTDSVTGLMTQAPEAQTHSPTMSGVAIGGSADVAQMKVSFGMPFIIECTLSADETGGAVTDILSALSGRPLDVFPQYDATAPVGTTGSPFRFKVVDVMVVTLDDGTINGSDTILLQKVDTDLTSQTDITDAMTPNSTQDQNVRATLLDQDACVISVGENLRWDLVLAATGNDRTLKGYITAMRCVSSE